MKKCAIILFFTIAIGTNLFASDDLLLDVGSRLYRDLEDWHSAGYIQTLPLIRPYAPAIVRRALNDVIEYSNPPPSPPSPPPALNDLAKHANAPAELRNKAADYLELIFDPKPKFRGVLEYIFRHGNDQWSNNLSPSITGIINLSQDERAETRAELNYVFNLLTGTSGTPLPYGQRDNRDHVPDWADFDIGSVNVQIRQYFYGLISRSMTSRDGLGITHFSAGMHRSSVGPNYNDSIILSVDTPAAGHFILGYDRAIGNPDKNGFIPRLNYGLQMIFLGGTSHQGPDPLKRGADLSGEKYLMLHSLHFDLGKWISLGLIESVVYGERIEPLYFIPISKFFLSQGLTGFGDNSLLGFEAEFRIPGNISIPLVIYIDDIHFNDVVRFKLDTKYKLAAQTAISWTPQLPGLTSLALGYTAVMPYMYTHIGSAIDNKDYKKPNYTNYTHRGSNIGPGLDPNSDRWVLSYALHPAQLPEASRSWLHDLELEANVSFIRHGNASSNQNGITNPTGDLFDPGYNDDGPTFQAPYEDPTGQPYTRFLTQDVIEHRLQIDARAEADIILSAKTSLGLSLGLSYTFEYTWNEDTVKGNNGLNNYLGFEIYFGRLR